MLPGARLPTEGSDLWEGVRRRPNTPRAPTRPRTQSEVAALVWPMLAIDWIPIANCPNRPPMQTGAEAGLRAIGRKAYRLGIPPDVRRMHAHLRKRRAERALKLPPARPSLQIP